LLVEYEARDVMPKFQQIAEKESSNETAIEKGSSDNDKKRIRF
jgi:hypothetical protein